jgi:hypothetical protein
MWRFLLLTDFDLHSYNSDENMTLMKFLMTLGEIYSLLKLNHE